MLYFVKRNFAKFCLTFEIKVSSVNGALRSTGRRAPAFDELIGQ